MAPTIAVFTKRPHLGEVKTRLSSQLGEHRAFEFYRASLQRTISIASPFGAEIWVEGEVTDPEWLQGLSRHSQVKGSLGTKMYNVFTYGCKLLIGCDVPLMTSEYLQDGLNRLNHCDLVLGPVEDGGYCLIGMNQPRAAVFDHIDWSTDQVLAQTLERAATVDLTVELLDELWDVDDIKNYQRMLDLNSTG